MEYTTEELRERKALTDAIVRNLAIINDDENDLDELDTQTCCIVGNLQVIDEDDTDLEEMARLSGGTYWHVVWTTRRVSESRCC
jgi:hypothetical protein